MKKKVKRSIIVAAGVVVAGVAGLNVLAYNHARTMTRFTTGGVGTSSPEDLTVWKKAKVLLSGVNVPRPEGKRPASDLASDCRTVTINAPDDIALEAWYCDRGATTSLVMLFHGYSAEKSSLMEEAQAFLELGSSVLLVDFRGSGGSSESYTTVGVREAGDVAAVVRFVEKNCLHSSTILFGQSMGAVAILRAINSDHIQPDAIVLEAVFDTMLTTVRNRFHAMRVPSFPSAELLVFWGGRQWRFNGFKHNPVDYASSVNCPALFMHGRDDPRATLDEGRRVFDAVPSSKEWVQFDGVGHQSYIAANPSEWRTAVGKAIRKAESKTSEDIADSAQNPQR